MDLNCFTANLGGNQDVVLQENRGTSQNPMVPPSFSKIAMSILAAFFRHQNPMQDAKIQLTDFLAATLKPSHVKSEKVLEAAEKKRRNVFPEDFTIFHRQNMVGMYPLVMTNSSPWYRWPIEIDGLGNLKMCGSFQFAMLNNQRVT
jgi:hypothetical protein